MMHNSKGGKMFRLCCFKTYNEDMESSQKRSFPKTEHLCSRRLIEALFAGGSKSMSSFPIRAVYMILPPEYSSTARVSVLISVSKRHFKLAVKRNRVKRQIREAYRKNKILLTHALDGKQETRLAVAFLWLSDRLHPTSEVEKSIRHLLTRIAEQLTDRPSTRRHEQTV